jgi:tetratricopeptide (TPR) repeat protein
MSTIEDTSPVPAAGALSLRRRLSLIGIASALLLILILAGAGYAGYQAGLTQRETQYEATQAADLQLQYELGMADLAAGRYEVAAARFEYIVKLDPAYGDAAQQLANARAGLSATATPRPLPTITPTPAASPTPFTAGAAEAIFALAQDAYAAGDWDEVLAQLARLHAVDPEYEAVRVDGMLYVSLRNRGIARILGDEMEAGMFDLDQAEAFGPLDTEALNYRAWARLYLAAQSYWGLDWRQAADILEQLYVIAPYFRDTSTRLYRATVNYADQLLAAGDFCAAEERYLRAQALFTDDAAVAESLAEAQAACAQTPTPDPLATGGTPPGDGTTEPGGTATPEP